MENNGGNSKLHITSSVMFDAAGTYIDVRLVYPGVRKRDKQLEKIPKTGVTGEWKHSVSDHGYVTRDIFLEILQDLDHHLTTANIKGCGHFKQFAFCRPCMVVSSHNYDYPHTALIINHWFCWF